MNKFYVFFCYPNFCKNFYGSIDKFFKNNEQLHDNYYTGNINDKIYFSLIRCDIIDLLSPSAKTMFIERSYMVGSPLHKEIKKYCKLLKIPYEFISKDHSCGFYQITLTNEQVMYLKLIN